MEASGRVEHYFKKFSACPIPNKYASEILNNGNLRLLDDGFHYSRKINDEEEIVKCIFGFPNKELYDEVVANIREYQNFIDAVKNTKVFESCLNLGSDVNLAIYYYENFYRMKNENDYNELPPCYESPLNFATEVLGKAVLSTLYSPRHLSIVKSYYRKIKEIRNEFEPLICHKIKFKLL